ncbi:MAG: hypothetical protein GY820_08550 [Gammaproteobacteria bacterium]|nr:hypothetical protein [Gammaproteobacteria bacterium]
MEKAKKFYFAEKNKKSTFFPDHGFLKFLRLLNGEGPYMSCSIFEFETFTHSRGASHFMRAIFPKNYENQNRENDRQIAATREQLIGFGSNLVRRLLTQCSFE